MRYDYALLPKDTFLPDPKKKIIFISGPRTTVTIEVLVGDDFTKKPTVFLNLASEF